MYAIRERSPITIPGDANFLPVGREWTNWMYEVAVNAESINLRAPFAYNDHLAGDVQALRCFMLTSPHIADYFDFRLRHDTRGTLVQAPNVDRLNADKAVLSEVAGVNTGQFVAVDANIIPGVRYLKYFANRKIPISQRPKGAIHDIAAHALGFAIMNDAMFGTLVGAARRALRSARKMRISAGEELVDGVSARLVKGGGYINAEALGTSYESSLPLVLSIFRARRDAAEQVKTMKRVNDFLAA